MITLKINLFKKIKETKNKYYSTLNTIILYFYKLWYNNPSTADASHTNASTTFRRRHPAAAGTTRANLPLQWWRPCQRLHGALTDTSNDIFVFCYPQFYTVRSVLWNRCDNYM